MCIEVKHVYDWEQDGEETRCGVALFNRKTGRPLPIGLKAFEEPTDPDDDDAPDSRAERFIEYCERGGFILDERITPQDGAALGALLDSWRLAEKAIAEESRGTEEPESSREILEAWDPELQDTRGGAF